MPLSPSEAEQVASEVHQLRDKDRRRLDKIRTYVKGEPKLVWLPLGTPRELQALAQMARVNVMELVVKSTSQQLFVDGYVSDDSTADQAIWATWRRNRWGRKQIGVHRSVSKYGVGYGAVLPGHNGIPVLRPASPLAMTTAFGADDDWPRYALEHVGGPNWMLYDSEFTYPLTQLVGGRRKAGATVFQMRPGTEEPHEQEVTPVVRYTADEDLDDPIRGDVEPLFTLQDQINLITFHLMVAEHYGAHGRKIIIGRMVKDLEEKLVKASANTMMTVNAEPGDVQFEELSQTDLSGFIESRQAALRMMSAISQTPAHELLGTLANLSAAALVEVRESTARKIEERQVILGEAHEQLLSQAGTLLGFPVDPMAQVKWKPTMDQRAVQLVGLLGTMAGQLNVPPQALWEHLPFTSEEIQRFREAADQAPEPEPEPDLDDPTDQVEFETESSESE